MSTVKMPANHQHSFTLPLYVMGVADPRYARCVCGAQERRPEPFAVARRSDPYTSHEAAASVSGIRDSQAEVFALFADRDLSDEQMIERAKEVGLRQSVSGLRTRRSELVRLRLLRDTGKTILTESRRHSIVWGKP